MQPYDAQDDHRRYSQAAHNSNPPHQPSPNPPLPNHQPTYARPHQYQQYSTHLPPPFTAPLVPLPEAQHYVLRQQPSDHTALSGGGVQGGYQGSYGAPPYTGGGPGTFSHGEGGQVRDGRWGQPEGGSHSQQLAASYAPQAQQATQWEEAYEPAPFQQYPPQQPPQTLFFPDAPLHDLPPPVPSTSQGYHYPQQLPPLQEQQYYGQQYLSHPNPTPAPCPSTSQPAFQTLNYALPPSHPLPNEYAPASLPPASCAPPAPQSFDGYPSSSSLPPFNPSSILPNPYLSHSISPPPQPSSFAQPRNISIAADGSSDNSTSSPRGSSASPAHSILQNRSSLSPTYDLPPPPPAKQAHTLSVSTGGPPVRSSLSPTYPQSGPYLPSPISPPPAAPSLAAKSSPASDDAPPVYEAIPFDASRNPADPYVAPSESTPAVSRSVLVAAAFRKKLGVIDLTGRRTTASSPSASSSSSAPQPAKPPAALRGKPTANLVVTCANYPSDGCTHGLLGRVVLRGGCVDTLPNSAGADPSSYDYTFHCLSCKPLAATLASQKAAAASEDPMADEARYETMLSGATDAYLGTDPWTSDSRPEPAGVGRIVSGFVSAEEVTGKGKGKEGTKKRAAGSLDGAVKQGVLVCDVCSRDVGSGTLVRKVGGKAVTATAEVICAHCDERYLRCSDCGGGGSGKGVGRWRSKELFIDGRKTCMLAHGRAPSVTNVDFDVHMIESIPADQLDEVIDTIFSFFTKTAFLTAAIPELCEGHSPIARSFEELEKVAVDLWAVFENIIRGEAESTFPTRRYLAFYWAPPPTQSKKKEKTHSRRGSLRVGEAPRIVPPKEEKVLSGCILAEHDLPSGSIHLAFHLPFSVGEAGVALGSLTRVLCSRARLELMLLNEQRLQEGKKEFPPLTTAWTVRLNKRDSRLMSRSTRLQWTSFDDYLKKYSEDTDPQHFPPYRKLYQTPELLHGWWIYATRIDQEDEEEEAPEDLSALDM